MIVVFFIAIFFAPFAQGMNKKHYTNTTFEFFSEESDSSGQSNSTDSSEENDIIYEKLEKYLKNACYNELKMSLMQQNVQDYIAKDSTLLFWAVENTDNPLMIKLLIDHGINLDYWDEDSNETIFHIITAHERLIDYDVMLALISRFITTKNPLELETLSIVFEKANLYNKTAFQQGHSKQKIFLKEYGRPYLYIDPLVEIILKKRDPEFLRNYIIPIINYHNIMESDQKFNTLKNEPQKANYIHEENKPLYPIIRPSIAINFLSHNLWNKRFLSNKTNTKLLKEIRKYRRDHNYDQFPLPAIVTEIMEYKQETRKIHISSPQIQRSTSLPSETRNCKRKLTPMIESLYIKNNIDSNTN